MKNKKFTIYKIDGTLKEKYYRTFRSIVSLNDWCINQKWQWKKDETVFQGYFVDGDCNAYVIR